MMRSWGKWAKRTTTWSNHNRAGPVAGKCPALPKNPIGMADTPVARALGRRLEAPAAERNKNFILEQLRRHLPPGDAPVRVLSVAEGTGTHASYFVLEEPRLYVLPTDPSEESRESIDARRADLPDNDRLRLGPATNLDVLDDAHWAALGTGTWDLITAINVLHISPQACTGALFKGAAGALHEGGTALIYGPFLVDGRPTTESNAEFDVKLRAMDPRFGLRDVAAVTAAAATFGFVLREQTPMPANNFVLAFTKASHAA